MHDQQIESELCITVERENNYLGSFEVRCNSLCRISCNFLHNAEVARQPFRSSNVRHIVCQKCHTCHTVVTPYVIEV